MLHPPVIGPHHRGRRNESEAVEEDAVAAVEINAAKLVPHDLEDHVLPGDFGRIDVDVGAGRAPGDPLVLSGQDELPQRSWSAQLDGRMF